MIEETSRARSTYIDIIKAIGIISIVLGHGCYSVRIPGTNVALGHFVYSYHIMVFFFTAGFCFNPLNPEKLELFVGKKIISTGKLFVIYNSIFVLLHNSLLRMNFLDINTNELYTIPEMIRKIGSGILFIQTEQLLGALWFLPMFLLGMILFCVILYMTSYLKIVWLQYVLPVILAVFALYVNDQEITWLYHLQTSLLGIPIIYAGYFCKRFWKNIEGYVSIIGAGASAGVLTFLLSLNIGTIELSVNSVANPFVFYLLTFLGIYFCMGAAKLIDGMSLLCKGFSAIGRNSFHIMALHFTAFKILDICVGHMRGADALAQSRQFPHADFGMTYQYIIVGIAFPLLIVAVLQKGKSWMVKVRKR